MPPTPASSEAFWPRVREAVAQSPNRRLRIALDGAQLVEVADEGVLIEVSRSLFATAAASAGELEALVARVAGRALPVRFRAPEAPSPPAPEQAGGPASPASVQDHELVRRAVELFGARVVSVQPRAPKDDSREG